jgi:hypothetical protein
MRCRRRLCREVVHVGSERGKVLGINPVVSLVVVHDGDEELEEQCCGIIQANTETNETIMSTAFADGIPLIKCKSNDTIATVVTCLLQ